MSGRPRTDKGSRSREAEAPREATCEHINKYKQTQKNIERERKRERANKREGLRERDLRCHALGSS
jgi:hypothetical protein